MKKKPLQKIAALTLALTVSSLSPSGAAVAKPNHDPQPSTVNLGAGGRSTKVFLITDATLPRNSSGSVVPTWLWVTLGGLALWNLLLSYIVWKNFENFDKKTYKNDRKIKDLDSKNISLDHRIDRRNADIEDLTRRVDTLSLSSLQSGMLMDLDLDDDAASEIHHAKAQDQDQSPSFDLAPDFGLTPDLGLLSQPSSNPTEPWNTIIQNYRNSPQALEPYIVERVSETDESLASRRNSSQADILLKPSANSNYWIFRGEDQNSWLVPKNDLRLTSIIYETFQALFDCQEYRPDQKLQVVKPAKVFFNFSTNSWELEQKGQVQFLEQTHSL